jgi:hypothetical protein
MGVTSEATALAPLALALACLSCATAKPPPTATSAPAEQLSTMPARHTSQAEPCATGSCLAKTSVPLFFPSYTKPCNDEGSVKAVMLSQMSPALSQVSEALFHARGDEEARLKAVGDAAAVMLGCATVIAHHGKEIHTDSWPTFDHFLHQLVVDVNALQNASMEDDIPEVTHWYHHVKQACASCHSRFWKR